MDVTRVVVLGVAVLVAGCSTRSPISSSSSSGSSTGEDTSGSASVSASTTISTSVGTTSPKLDLGTCDSAGCGAPPSCADGCLDPCGCCSCDGDQCAIAEKLGPGVLQCVEEGCFQYTQCSELGCIQVDDTEALCVDMLETCEQVEALYNELVSGDHQTCNTPDDCQILEGKCDNGLGGCWEVVNGSTTQDQLDALGARWLQLECFGPVCDCSGPSPTTCADGICAWQP